MTNPDEEEQGLLMGIPDEMWKNILNETTMNSDDMANFRSLNIKCNTLADNLFDRWIIKIDDRHEHKKKKGPYLETLLDFRIEELRISNLKKPLSFRPPGIILKYPDLLKVIRIKPDSKKKLGISAKNLHVLLKSKNIEKLYLELADANINSLVYSSEPPLIGYDFSKVQELTIRIDNTPKKLKEWNLVQRVLKNSIFSNLNCLDINYFELDDPDDDASTVIAYRMSFDVLEFIIKYGHILRSLKLHIFSYDVSQNFLEDLDASGLENCSNLESLNVNSHFLHESMEYLLGLQKKAVHLEFYEFIPISLFKTLIERNCNTLSYIDLRILSDDDEGVAVRLLDFSIFSNCLNLRHLSLAGDDFQNLVEGRNLSVLHQKIEFMNLCRIQCSSEDLLMFSSNREKLRSLDLSECGSLGGLGINGSVLENLLSLSQLSELHILGKSINRSIPTEALKLKSILDHLGIDPDYFYTVIDLKRDARTNLWCE